MLAVARWLERLGQALGLAAIAVIALLAFPIFYDALARKVGVPTVWVFEVSQYALIAGMFLANAYALRHGNHFRVELLLTLLPRHGRRLDDQALGVTLVFGAIVAIGGGILVHYSYTNGIRSASLLNTPLYLPQSTIPLGGLALVLQAAAMLIRRESPSTAAHF